MLQPVSKALLLVGLLCGLYAFSGGTPAKGDSMPAPVAQLSLGGGKEIGTAELVKGGISAKGDSTPAPVAQLSLGGGKEIGTAELVCGGQVCTAGEQCCSCKVSPSSPLTFFCHTPDFCPHGTICTIPPP
jgi:hypothetical protein